MAELVHNQETNGVSAVKIAKVDKQSDIKDLSHFSLKRVLNNNTDRKAVFIEGSFEDRDGKAVLILEKQAFEEKALNSLRDVSTLEKQFSNDVYGNYECFIDPKFNGECYNN